MKPRRLLSLFSRRVLPRVSRAVPGAGATLAFKTLAVAALLGGRAAATTEWIWHKTADGTHPDGGEQQSVWLMNRARANPAAEGEFLANTGDPGVRDAITYFRVNVAKMKAEFAALPPAPPAVFDRRIYEASRQHSLDLIRRDTQDHVNQPQRVLAAGFLFARASFNVYSYTVSTFEAHALFNIDIGVTADGMQEGRRHRNAIMSAAYTNMGLAAVPENNPATTVGPLVISSAHASAQENGVDQFNRFITGTVWDDLNGNRRYDPGEGIGGVLVQPDRGDWHAVTGMAGGFAFPAVETGAYRLIFTGGSLPGVYTRTVTVAGDSVLVDLEIAPLPPQPLRLAIRPGSDGRSVILEWSGGKPPWQVLTAPNPLGPWTPLGQPTRQAYLVLPAGGSSAFFRVTGQP